MDSNPSSGKGFVGAVEVDGVLVHMDILTQSFCCNIPACHGRCCEEGDAGAPVTLDEVAQIEDQLDAIWSQLSAQAQSLIDRQGVAYTDPEGELVTTIINGKDCAFRGPQGCLLNPRPISCHLYPIRERKLGPLTGLNYHRWDICKDAVLLGQQQGIPVYRFLREPLVRRFGESWYQQLEETVRELRKQGYLD